ncbi:hypothetical protein B0533_01910 [Sedimentibacter sp. SX930]|nr:hypothetical protein B0533_01910 [Sedimentibacter sp. SX930]
MNAMKKQHAVSQITGDGVLFYFIHFDGSVGRLLRPSRPWPEEKIKLVAELRRGRRDRSRIEIPHLYSGEASLTGGKTGIQPGSSL